MGQALAAAYPEARCVFDEADTAYADGALVANVDAQPKREAWSAIDALVRQVSAPVRWSDVVKRLASEGVTTYVEVGPGAVLSGLVKKIHSDARVVQFGSPDDLGAIVAACSTSAEK